MAKKSPADSQDFSLDEIADINRAVAMADAEFERGEGMAASVFYKEVGL